MLVTLDLYVTPGRHSMRVKLSGYNLESGAESSVISHVARSMVIMYYYLQSIVRWSGVSCSDGNVVCDRGVILQQSNILSEHFTSEVCSCNHSAI